jgi:hypothetical protein
MGIRSQQSVRHGYVTKADDWPYQGELNELRRMGRAEARPSGRGMGHAEARPSEGEAWDVRKHVPPR